MSETCECLTVEINIIGHGKLFITAIDRPPDRSLSLFFDYINQACEFLCDRKRVLIGDFNIDVSTINEVSLPYIDTIESYDFKNEISLKTYVSPITVQEK